MIAKNYGSRGQPLLQLESYGAQHTEDPLHHAVSIARFDRDGKRPFSLPLQGELPGTARNNSML